MKAEWKTTESRSFCRDGMAAIEYALILAMVVLGAVFVIDLVSVSTGRHFDSIAHNALGGEGTDGAESAHLHKSSTSQGGNAGSESAETTVVYGLPSGPDQMPLWRMSLTLAVLVSLSYVVGAGRAYRRRAADIRAQSETLTALQKRVYQKRQAIMRVLANDLHGLARGETRVRHVMTTQVDAVSEGESVDEVANRLNARASHHLLVCAEDGSLVGVISDRDLGQRVGRRASDVMTGEPLTVSPDAALAPAVSMMLNRRISCLPVIDNGRLVGVLTSTDLMMALQCTLQLLHQLTERLSESELDDSRSGGMTITEICRQKETADVS